MYAGPGPVSLMAAAAAWDGLAAELHSAASSYRSVIAGLTTGRWMGPSSLSMASAFGPYVAWTAGAAARAAESAAQARLAAQIYEAAFAMIVPPTAVTANRVQLSTLTATNFFGQNGPAIAANEAAYAEMWAQDAAAMYGYAAGSAEASMVTLFTPAPQTTNPAGVLGQAATFSGTQQSAAANVVSSVPTLLQSFASPSSSTSLGSLTSLSSLFSSTSSGSVTGLFGTGSGGNIAESVISQYAVIPGWFGMFIGSNALSPLTWTPISNSFIPPWVELPADAAAQGALGAAEQVAAVQTVGAVGPGAGVVGSLGKAAALGPLSVPASWTSVIPPTQMSAAAALPNATLAGAHGSPSVLGALPPAAALNGSGRSMGPRYGVVPTVMTRPPSGGYA